MKNNFYCLFLIVSISAVFMTGCKSMQFSGYSPEQRGEIYSQQPLYRVEPSTTTPELWERHVNKYAIHLRLDPEFPSATDYVKIGVMVFDISRNPPRPVTGAKISCSATMPNIPGYVHWLANNVCYLNERNPGFCEMESVVFGTGGDWDLIVKTDIPGETVSTEVFPLRVKGPPWPPNRVPDQFK